MSNADQQEFWAGPSGAAWVRLQADMDAMLQPVTDLVLEAAALPHGARVLDVGCGTGATVIAALAQVGPTGHVTGLDISEVMLDLARERLRAHPNTTCLMADAQTHAFAPASFDAVISRFGVMFFEDTTAAFANMAHALTPGATLTLASWGPPPQNPYFMDPAAAATEIFGPMDKVDRTLPGPFAFEDAARIIPMLEAAGLVDVTVRPLPVHFSPRGSVDDVAELCCQIGPAMRSLAHFNASAADRARLARAISDRMAAYQSPQGVRIPGLINLYQARAAA
jgi:SAM-dependent methyltransferase